jgi:hypothetical protein
MSISLKKEHLAHINGLFAQYKDADYLDIQQTGSYVFIYVMGRNQNGLSEVLYSETLV